MEILCSIFIGIIFGMIVGMIVGIGLQCRRGSGCPGRAGAPGQMAVGEWGDLVVCLDLALSAL